ncbi:MAG: hypothetical protein QM756_15385 [Polyangiaceae bacterium]
MKLLDAGLVTDRRVRKGAALARGSVGSIAALAVHVIELLGARVVRFEVFVGDGPSRATPSSVAKLAEIFFAQAEQGCAVELGVTADVVVRVRMQRLPVRVSPDLFGVVAALKLTASELQFSFSRRT